MFPVAEGSHFSASYTFMPLSPHRLPASPRSWPQPLGVPSKGIVPRELVAPSPRSKQVMLSLLRAIKPLRMG